MSGQKKQPTLTAEQIEKMLAFLEWNRACALQAEERGQTDTCYHTDIIKLTAALKEAGVPVEE